MEPLDRRRLSSHALVFAAYSLLAVVMTLPFALHLGDALIAVDSSGLNDAYLTVWILGWGAHQLVTDPLNLFHGNIFYPFAHTLAFSEIILPGTLLYLPFWLSTGNPVFAHNLVVLLSFPLNAFAMYLYAADWLGEVGGAANARSEPRGAMGETLWSAVIAGIIFGFCTFKMGELRHVQLLMAMFMPLTLLFLARFERAPSLANALATALCFALNALASLYYGVFLAFAVVLQVAVDGLRRRFRYSRAHLLYGLVALAAAVALVLPFARPYLRLEHQHHFSATRDPRSFSARPASYLATPWAQWLYGKLTRPFYVASKGQPLFPGAATLALAVMGLVGLGRERDRSWVFPALLALMGFVLSLGPSLVLNRAVTPALPFPLPYYYLSLVVSPLRGLGAPARFAVLIMLGLSLLAARGVVALLRRFPRRGRAVALATATLILLEYVVVPVHLQPVAPDSPACRFLAGQPRGQVVVEVPMGKPTYVGQSRQAIYVYHALLHGLPVVNGYSGYIPPEYYALVRDMEAFPSAATVERLSKWGVDWIVVHADRYGDTEKLRLRLEGLEGIAHVRDFGAVWLYRVRR